MVIWVAVGGRATLVGAVLGAVLVNMARSLLSERFPDVWLFFQGGLFLLVVTALPNGIVGWLRQQFGLQMQKWLGLASPTLLAETASLETPDNSVQARAGIVSDIAEPRGLEGGNS